MPTVRFCGFSPADCHNGVYVTSYKNTNNVNSKVKESAYERKKRKHRHANIELWMGARNAGTLHSVVAQGWPALGVANFLVRQLHLHVRQAVSTGPSEVTADLII